MEKYASYVIEKCIEVKEEDILGDYIDEICNNNGILGIYIYYYKRLDEKQLWQLRNSKSFKNIN